jgi:hypothetical protein
MKSYNPSAGKVVNRGAGGFLNPPTHPEHTKSIETDLRRRPENRGSMSLSYAATCEHTDPATRMRAKMALKAWVRPDINSQEVQEWIHQVLGYFSTMYQKLEGSWNCDNLYSDKDLDPVLNANRHAGVHCIRKYYPEFVPTTEHFAKAYWGTKPEKVEA